MAIDLSQFHQVFFEESFESVDTMETSLMELDPQAVDDETINAIFRAAHSIKGGSATFGFTAISGFTHILETLLDQIRAGKRDVTKEDINLFLQSVDCLREMLSMLQSGEDADTEMSREVASKFNALLEGKSAPVAEPTAPKAETAPDEPSKKESTATRWRINFHPNAEVLKTGNDPLRIIRELSLLGELTSKTHMDHLPDLHGLHVEESYLYWELILNADVEKSAIEEVFEWVADESNIEIVQESGEGSDSPSKPDATFWSIMFEPKPHILQTGNDPVKLFQVLSDIGKIRSIKPQASFPGFRTMDPEQCFLSWRILLEAESEDLSKIEEVFEWVKDDSDIEIKSVSGLFAESMEADDEVLTDSANTVVESTPVSQEEPSKASLKVVAKKASPKPAAKSANAESSSIRVGIDKVDNLINMVGELVITQSMLGQLGTDFDLERLPKLLEGLGQLEQNTRELQESVMKIRMLPISFVFSRFPRMVRDLSQSLDKEINLEILGDQTELDKTVLEKIGDPLVHLVRNAVDHGIESVDDRVAKGKSGEGAVRLNAYHQGGNVVIEVVDDGKGLDPDSLKEKAIEKGVITASEAENLTREQCFDLIFQPGFSTAKEISDVSGRGVGMDVVKRNIQALNGHIDIQSEVDRGSTITIRLPLTLAILDGQLVRVANQTYILPIVSIVESLQCKAELINRVAGGSEVFRLRDEYVPIIHLAKAFNIPVDSDSLEGSLLVVVESEGEKIGIVVDELLAQQQVVIKSLEQNYKRVRGVSGATILGDGTVALIADIPGIVRLVGDNFKIIQEAANSMLASNQHQVSHQLGL